MFFSLIISGEVLKNLVRCFKFFVCFFVIVLMFMVVFIKSRRKSLFVIRLKYDFLRFNLVMWYFVFLSIVLMVFMSFFFFIVFKYL